jgi:small subunit ribosomal protein S8e
LTIYQTKLYKRKKTGGKKGRPYRGRRVFETGREPILTTCEQNDTIVSYRTRGGDIKHRVKGARHVNVAVSKGVVKRAEIQEAVKNDSNQLYQRRGIITKGAIVRTSLGLVRVTSRPGSDGSINGFLVGDEDSEK